MKKIEQKEPVIEIRGLHKHFKKLKAVNGVDLTLYRGEFIGLLGPNGAGKTTLVEMIEGLQKPTRGEISIFGETWKKNETKLRKKLCMTLQETRLMPKLKVLETVNLFGSFYGCSKKDSERVLELVELQEKKKAFVETLSGGQRQRLALAIALINQPEILILDEPTVGLDPNVRRGTWNILKNLNNEHNTTIILTSHYMDEVEYLCDRICVMHKGTVLTQGTLDELLDEFGDGEVIEYGIGTGYDEKHIKTLPDVVHYSFDDKVNKVKMLVQNTEKFLPSFFEAIKKCNVEIHHLVARKRTLDDLFIALAGRSLHE